MIQPAFEILNQRGTPMFFSDVFANIPTAGIPGRIFIRTDSPYGIYRDTGSAWDQIAGSGGGGGITGSGVAGQVTFWDGTSSVSGSNDLWFDNASSKFLVGTNNTAGAGKLQVTSATGDDQLRVWGANSPSIRIDNAVSGATQRFVMGLATATNNFIQGSAAGNICISTASANPLLFGMWQTSNAIEVMRISTGNRLLIGTTTDAGFKLDVSGTGRFSSDILVNSLKIGKGNGSQSANTALGELSLNAITNGYNTAVGYYAMRLPTNCVFNTAIGVQSLESGTSYNENTALGYRSLQKLSTGNANTALGTQSGQTITGGSNLTDSSSSIFIGYQAGANGNSQTNQIVIGNQVYGLGSNTTSIGNSSTTFAAIYGNLLLGSTTNQGQKLYVNGSVRIDGQTAATAGGSAGLHLILNLDGTNYKIALLNV